MRERLESLNWKLLWAIVSCIVIFIGTFAVVVWLRDRDIAKIEELSKVNRQLISRVDNLQERLADTAYDECTTRNTRAVESTKALARLVAASRMDKNKASEKIWQDFVDQAKKNPLPPCEKPEGYEKRKKQGK